jgi:parallel beta-helix repeat protein
MRKDVDMFDLPRARRFAFALCAFTVTGGVLLAEQTPAADTGSGLTAQFFRGVSLGGDPLLTQIVSSINFDWGVGSPTGVPFNQFSARVTGDLVAPTTGEYTFYATADDGVRLSLNGESVLNDWSDHPARESRGSRFMAQGERMYTELEYFENRGRASLKLEWSGPGVSRQIIPTSQLFPTGRSGAPTTLPVVVPPVLTTQAPTQANTFYVAPDGSDDNPGTQQAPWRTTKKVTETLTAGQTALFGAGTYDNGFFITRSGAPGKYITFAAAPGATPTIRVTEPNDNGAKLIGASYIRIVGFDFSYQGPDAATDQRFATNAGINAFANDAGAQSHHIEFVGNYIHDFPAQGVGSGQADYVLIEGNTVWNNSKWDPVQTSGISLFQSANVDLEPGFHNVIRGNVVFNNENRVPNNSANPEITDGNCIIIDDQRRRQDPGGTVLGKGPYESDTLIENNVCVGNGGRGIHILDSDNVLVRNNTLYNNARTESIGGSELSVGLFSDLNAPNQTRARQAPKRRGNIRFVNNLVVSDKEGARYKTNDDRDRANAVFERNFYFGTRPLPADGSQVLSSSSPDDIIGTSNPLVNPQFNVFEANFRLRAGSAAIDVGRTDGAPAFDQAGLSRPFGSGPDIGAYEWRP